VLRILLENAGHLVNKQQVLDAVWPGTFVGDAVLKDNIRQLREALNDDAGSPRHIETAHRRGYRFIARLSERSQGRSKSALVRQPDLSAVLDNAGSVSWATPRLLGREPELAKFRDLMERARGGERQTVFITGEAGIGKTTLVQAFVDHAAQIPGALIVRGQCLEHFGSSEAYLPVLDGFSRLCRGADTHVCDVLREHAPSWLGHISF